MRQSGWAPGGGNSQTEGQRRRGESSLQAEEQPDQGLRGQNTEPLCLDLVKFAEGIPVGRGERRNGDFTLRAGRAMGGFKARGAECCWRGPENEHPAGNT